MLKKTYGFLLRRAKRRFEAVLTDGVEQGGGQGACERDHNIWRARWRGSRIPNEYPCHDSCLGCDAMWQRLWRIVLFCFSIEDMVQALMNAPVSRKAKTGSM